MLRWGVHKWSKDQGCPLGKSKNMSEKQCNKKTILLDTPMLPNWLKKKQSEQTNQRWRDWIPIKNYPCGKPLTIWLHWLTPPNIQEFGRIVTRLFVTNSTQTLPKIRRGNTSESFHEADILIPKPDKDTTKNHKPVSLGNMNIHSIKYQQTASSYT